MSLHIRQATAQDLPQILQLYAQPSMDNGKVMALAAAKQQFAHFSQYPSYRLFVACQADADANANANANANAQEQVLGTYALLVMHNLAHQGTPSAIVEDVVVSEAHRSQGVGRAMMAHAMDLARQAGCYKLVLSSNQKRERAHAFYESLGFQRHGFSFQIEM